MDASLSNYSLKEDIRSYWSARSATFDLAFGHRIGPGTEFGAWRRIIREILGSQPLNVLELACGTGEITTVLTSLGHVVTALDFSEAMLGVARHKHTDNPRVRFALADAENTMEPDNCYDAIVCRHLVWTLTTPASTFLDWYRVLKPGGRLLVFDGDWAKPIPSGRLASFLIALMDKVLGADPDYDGAMSDRHANIMSRLPYGNGLQAPVLARDLQAAGFGDIKVMSHSPIAAAQRRNADLRNTLRTFVYQRFVLSAEKADHAAA